MTYQQLYHHKLDSLLMTVFCIYQSGTSLTETLQNNLDKLAQWEQQWGMQFHPSKCNSMSVTRSKTPFKFNYILKGHTLESVDTAKYLGIMHHLIQHDMECTHKQHNIKSTEIIRIFLEETSK